MAPRLAVVKSCAAIASITTALLTCLLACLSSDSETGLALLALSSGLVTAPIYAAFFVMEVYSLLIRPNMLARNGMVPLLDEGMRILFSRYFSH